MSFLSSRNYSPVSFDVTSFGAHTHTHTCIHQHFGHIDIKDSHQFIHADGHFKNILEFKKTTGLIVSTKFITSQKLVSHSLNFVIIAVMLVCHLQPLATEQSLWALGLFYRIVLEKFLRSSTNRKSHIVSLRAGAGNSTRTLARSKGTSRNFMHLESQA